MELQSLGEEQFAFTKYQEINQLGRYYSITLNGKITRLYTSVNFLVGENKTFLRKVLGEGIGHEGKPFAMTTNESNLTMGDLGRELEDRSMSVLAKAPETIPILFKTYSEGQFTNTIVTKPVESVVISCLKGEGLQLSRTAPGRIVIVAGGTGIYPFCDLIDLLFKQALIQNQPHLEAEVLTLSPILKNKPFEGFTFHLMAAFTYLDDIHPNDTGLYFIALVHYACIYQTAKGVTQYATGDGVLLCFGFGEAVPDSRKGSGCRKIGG